MFNAVRSRMRRKLGKGYIGQNLTMSTPLNIVIVEDSKDDAELLVQELRLAGYEPTWKRVETEQEYRHALEQDLDVILSDFTLPRFSTQRAIQMLNDSGKDIPLIIVSGTIGEDAAVECMKLGASDYLVKDRLARLGNAIHRALKERSLRREKRNAELALQNIQRRLAHLMASSPSVTYQMEVRGETVFPVWVSENVTALVGFQPGEVLNPEWWLRQVHPDDHDRVLSEFDELMSRGRLVQEYRLRRKDGNYIWIHDEKLLLRSETGSPDEIVGTWLDITERKSLEAQLWQSQKLESIGLLAGGIAHDFNNILVVIQGHASLIRTQEKLDREVSESVEQIALAGERAVALTRQLLTFSRKQVIQPRNLDINELVRNLAKMLRRMMGEDVVLSLQLAPGTMLIHADMGMMEQVLMNLAVNARDAMPDGGDIVISTGLEIVDEVLRELNPEAKPGHHVCLTISDTGCGIPPDVLPRIFEPFFTTKEAGKGTGLGLATVYGIVRQHGGWIRVYSETDKGTVFRIYLPIVAPKSRKSEQEITATEVRGGNETILLAEDDASVRALVRNLLERLGYHVLESSSGKAAVKIWAEHGKGIDLLLTDMVMPDGLTGWELSQKLRLERPSLKVIFSSGYSPDVVQKNFTLPPGSVFLQKPFSLPTLARAVRECLDGTARRG